MEKCILAMAGLAEAAAMIELAVSWLALFVLALLLFASAGTFRNRLFIASIVLTVLGVALLAPLNVPYINATAEELADPDYRYWLGRFRVLAFAWHGFIIMAVASISYHFLKRNGPSAV